MVLQGLGAYVAEGGRRGSNLIREYDAGMRVRLRRPLRDRYRRMPAFEVGIDRECCYSAASMISMQGLEAFGTRLLVLFSWSCRWACPCNSAACPLVRRASTEECWNVALMECKGSKILGLDEWCRSPVLLVQVTLFLSYRSSHGPCRVTDVDIRPNKFRVRLCHCRHRKACHQSKRATPSDRDTHSLQVWPAR